MHGPRPAFAFSIPAPRLLVCHFSHLFLIPHRLVSSPSRQASNPRITLPRSFLCAPCDSLLTPVSSFSSPSYPLQRRVVRSPPLFPHRRHRPLMLLRPDFEVTSPPQGTTVGNGTVLPVTWKKGLLDAVEFLDLELTRMSQDGLIFVARDSTSLAAQYSVFRHCRSSPFQYPRRWADLTSILIRYPRPTTTSSSSSTSPTASCMASPISSPSPTLIQATLLPNPYHPSRR
jgi:hypothetical protein